MVQPCGQNASRKVRESSPVATPMLKCPIEAARGVPRLDGARGKNRFGAPMFEHKVFRDCIEESTCDTVDTFRRPP